MIFLRFFIYLFILKLTSAEDNYDSHRRIIGGKYASNITKYPYMAELIQKFIDPKTGQESTAMCGGSILSPKFLLTAAHCLRQCNCPVGVDDSKCKNCINLDPASFTVYTGGLSPSSYGEVVESHIQSYYLPDQLKLTDTTHQCFLRFDIAVVQLKERLQLGPRMAIINLPDPVTLGVDDLSKTVTTKLTIKQKKCQTLGWGKTGETDTKPILDRYLKVAKIPLLDNEKCIYHLTKALPYSIFQNRGMCVDTHICSLDPRNAQGFCDGDSGGPLVLDNVQYGVISQCLRPTCVGKHLAQLYTRVDINVKWIRDILNKYG